MKKLTIISTPIFVYAAITDKLPIRMNFILTFCQAILYKN